MTAANATSYRRRFRYAKELRRYSQYAKWNTVAFPQAPVISDLSAVAGGTVKILVDQCSGFNRGTGQPTIEWSLNGTSGWTGVAASGYVAGQHVITTVAGIAAGLKFFRLKFNNTFGSGPVSNIKSVTVLA